jgi:hypothetical protein
MILRTDRNQEQADTLRELRKDLFTATERCIALRRDMSTTVTAYEEAQAQYERLRSPRQSRYAGEVLAQALTLAEQEIAQHIARMQALGEVRKAAAVAAGEAEARLLGMMVGAGER